MLCLGLVAHVSAFLPGKDKEQYAQGQKAKTQKTRELFLEAKAFFWKGGIPELTCCPVDSALDSPFLMPLFSSPILSSSFLLLQLLGQWVLAPKDKQRQKDSILALSSPMLCGDAGLSPGSLLSAGASHGHTLCNSDITNHARSLLFFPFHFMVYVFFSFVFILLSYTTS